jgi:adenylate kinase family enzyme
MSMNQEGVFQFLKTEKRQQLYTCYDETIVPLVVDRYTGKVFDDNQQTGFRNRITILEKNTDLLMDYDAYVHAVHTVYNKTLAWMKKTNLLKPYRQRTW